MSVEKEPDKVCAGKVSVPLVGDACWVWVRENTERICMHSLNVI